MAALAEVHGMREGADAGAEQRAARFAPVLKLHCARCKGSPVEVGRVYPTRQGLLLFAEWKRVRSEDGTRGSAGMFAHFLADPFVLPVGQAPAPDPAEIEALPNGEPSHVMPSKVTVVQAWSGHCPHHGWRQYPAIEKLREAALDPRVSTLRC